MGSIAGEYAVDEVNAELLKDWLDAGVWSKEEAILLFLDIDPDRKHRRCFTTFSGHGSIHYEYHDDSVASSIVQQGTDDDGEPDYLTAEQWTLLRNNKILSGQIEKKINLHESAEPVEWIDLALKKGITIPWLEWAIERKLYIPKQEADKTPSPDLDKASLTCQPELAMDASKGVVPASETKEQRQDRRLAACEAAGLVMPKSSIGPLPYGVGRMANLEGVKRQSFTPDVKAALRRREAITKPGRVVRQS